MLQSKRQCQSQTKKELFPFPPYMANYVHWLPGAALRRSTLYIVCDTNGSCLGTNYPGGVIRYLGGHPLLRHKITVASLYHIVTVANWKGTHILWNTVCCTCNTIHVPTTSPNKHRPVYMCINTCCIRAPTCTAIHISTLRWWIAHIITPATRSVFSGWYPCFSPLLHTVN